MPNLSIMATACRHIFLHPSPSHSKRKPSTSKSLLRNYEKLLPLYLLLSILKFICLRKDGVGSWAGGLFVRRRCPVHL